MLVLNKLNLFKSTYIESKSKIRSPKSKECCCYRGLIGTSELVIKFQKLEGYQVSIPKKLHIQSAISWKLNSGSPLIDSLQSLSLCIQVELDDDIF